MRAVIQRVAKAGVSVAGEDIARIGEGILALVAIANGDDQKDLEWMARKIVELRIFDDADGKLNLSLLETGGQLLLVSQFTLFGDPPTRSQPLPPRPRNFTNASFKSPASGCPACRPDSSKHRWK
jgi:D-tyrosyl-tRNA(Tyr) deacylase